MDGSAAESMPYGNLKGVVDRLSCRSISPLVMSEVPPCSFDLASFPMSELDTEGNPGVHFFDVIPDHPGEIHFFALSSAYKLTCEKKDLELLPVPFGMKEKCPKETTIQMVLLK